MAVQTEQTNAVAAVQDYIAVYNTHDLDASSKKLTPDIVISSPLLAGVRGLDAHRQTNLQFWKSMPDFQFTVLNIAANGDFVAAEMVGAGTSTGPTELPGRDPIPPTGKRVEFGLAGFFRVTPDGLIAEERYYYDRMALLQQLNS
ncbi:MAG TPA: ester cyclase [Acidimicrobiales bacterium]|nr:ester cyclase [Acidimicrobiales bacterium]